MNSILQTEGRLTYAVDCLSTFADFPSVVVHLDPVKSALRCGSCSFDIVLESISVRPVMDERLPIKVLMPFDFNVTLIQRPTMIDCHQSYWNPCVVSIFGDVTRFP